MEIKSAIGQRPKAVKMSEKFLPLGGYRDPPDVTFVLRELQDLYLFTAMSDRYI